MRKLLVLGLVMVVGVAGAVIAAQPRDDAPPVEPPKPPVVVAEKPEAPSKDEQKPAVAYTSSPRLTAGWDVPVSDAWEPRWNAEGSMLAVVGSESPAVKNPRRLFCLVKYTGKAQPGEVIRKALQKDTEFVGFTPDGKQVVTALREYGLLSGYHRLTYWDFAKTEGPTFLTEPPTLTLTTAAKVRSLDFDGGELREYAFPTDGKTFRSLRFERDSKGEVTRTEVVEVDGMTEEIGKTLLILDSAYTRFSHRFTFSPDGKRLGVFTNDVAKIAVYDLDRGEKLSEYKFPAERPGDFDLVLRMAFSQDGKRLVVARAIGQTVVLNADTGEALPVLEGLAMTSTSPDPQAFSGDGRLLAMRGTVHEPPRKGGIPSSGHRREVRSFLTVWDTQTGKVVKSWNRGPYAVFSPTRPVLAILEANGDSTRVGFWDFTAEVEKK